YRHRSPAGTAAPGGQRPPGPGHSDCQRPGPVATFCRHRPSTGEHPLMRVFREWPCTNDEQIMTTGILNIRRGAVFSALVSLILVALVVLCRAATAFRDQAPRAAHQLADAAPA